MIPQYIKLSTMDLPRESVTKDDMLMALKIRF
jgi:hypothetical protein